MMCPQIRKAWLLFSYHIKKGTIKKRSLNMQIMIIRDRAKEDFDFLVLERQDQPFLFGSSQTEFAQIAHKLP